MLVKLVHSIQIYFIVGEPMHIFSTEAVAVILRCIYGASNKCASVII